MKLKGLIDEDFCNYKKPSMFLAFPRCTFKCGEVCQNLPIAQEPDIEVAPSEIVKRYTSNPITEAIVFGGLEPFDSFSDMLTLIGKLRAKTDDDIVIYTGYNEDEIANLLELVKEYPNITIKFGRYIPNEEPHFDEVLGIKLASNNQYARRIN